jgi:hypothetical protein
LIKAKEIPQVDFSTSLLQLVLTPAAAAAVIAYVTRGLFAQLLHRDLEHFKQLLQREGEQHRKLLEVVQFEHQTKFSWAHQRQAEVISQLYGKLASAQVRIAQMTSPVQFGGVDRAAQWQAAADAFTALTDYFEPNRLFFSEKRSEEVEAIIQMMRYSFNQFSIGQTERESSASRV